MPKKINQSHSSHTVGISWDKIWRFPEMGVPPNHHPFLDAIFPNKNHPLLGTPIDGNPHVTQRHYRRPPSARSATGARPKLWAIASLSWVTSTMERGRTSHPNDWSLETANHMFRKNMYMYTCVYIYIYKYIYMLHVGEQYCDP